MSASTDTTEEDLSNDDSANDNDSASDYDDAAEMAIRKIYKSQNSSADTVVGNSSTTDSVTDSDVSQDIEDSTYESAGSQSGTGTRSSGMRAQAANYRENEVGNQPRRKRLVTRLKTWALVLGVASFGYTLIKAIAEAVIAGQTPKAPGLSQQEKDKIVDRVKLWLKLPEKVVWTQMADYCDSFNPSWQAQILMVDTIKDLSPLLTEIWTWRDDDLALAVDKVVDAYGQFQPAKNQHQTSAIYRSLIGLTYDGYTKGMPVALPRVIAADVAELAIVEILHRNKTSMGGGNTDTDEDTDLGTLP
jgi:hypothetical protein